MTDSTQQNTTTSSPAGAPDASATSNAEQLAKLLDASGVDARTLAVALQSIATATKATAPPPDPDKSIYQDKELVYDDEYAYIYRRGDTKRRIYYIRIYDTNGKKPYIKSLETTDRAKAITTARIIYQEMKGKMDRGEKLRNITTDELIAEYLKGEQLKITDVPRQGITPDRMRVKKYYLRFLSQYIHELKLENIGIDKIAPYRTRKFGYWLQQQPKDQKSDNNPRSIELINNCISEIGKCYRDVAVRERYISKDQIPEIDRLREQPDDGHKRDILSLEQYEKLWRYMEYTYCRDKKVSKEERAKRVIFAKVIGLMYNTGLRCKELLGLQINEIYANPLDSEESRKTNVLIKVRANNSKTGRSRVLAAPVKKRIDVIKKKIAELGVELQPTDFLLINPASKDRKPYTRENLANRLRYVLKQSGIQKELDRENLKINLYSARHAYITWRLRYGNVPIQLLSKACGTSVNLIERVYARVEIEKQSDVLTRAQGFAKMSEVDLRSNIYSSSEE
ncbi:phage integrase family protein [Synechococcus sp. A18-40]|nr:phage integrase family protein [Synechococcus sp. A18-40]